MSTQRRRVLEDDGGKITITEDGVYIEGLNGKFYTVNNWQGGNDANSIVVASGDVKFRIALTQPSPYMQISSNNSDPLDNYMTAISGETAARADYNGSENTSNILKAVPNTSYAAGYCNAFIFPDGRTKGFLPSLGQLNLAYQNKLAVDDALRKCGGTAMNTSKGYWSSTFCGVDSRKGRCCWGFGWIGGGFGGYLLGAANFVRPFADIS